MAMVRARSAAAVATSRALDMEVDRVIRGEGRYPSLCAWCPADGATDASIEEAHARGMGVVIVDGRGNERFLPATEPREPGPWPDAPRCAAAPEPAPWWR